MRTDNPLKPPRRQFLARCGALRAFAVAAQMKRARIVVLAAAGVLVGLFPAVPAASSADPAVVGQWVPPFSEGGLFDERPPMSRDEAKKLPAAVSIAVSPDGTIMYWNGVE